MKNLLTFLFCQTRDFPNKLPTAVCPGLVATLRLGRERFFMYTFKLGQPPSMPVPISLKIRSIGQRSDLDGRSCGNGTSFWILMLLKIEWMGLKPGNQLVIPSQVQRLQPYNRYQ